MKERGKEPTKGRNDYMRLKYNSSLITSFFLIISHRTQNICKILISICKNPKLIQCHYINSKVCQNYTQDYASYLLRNVRRGTQASWG